LDATCSGEELSQPFAQINLFFGMEYLRNKEAAFETLQHVLEAAVPD